MPQDPRPQPFSIVPVAVSSPKEEVNPRPVRETIALVPLVPQSPEPHASLPHPVVWKASAVPTEEVSPMPVSETVVLDCSPQRPIPQEVPDSPQEFAIRSSSLCYS